jgi:hypothetical protein
MVVLRKAGGFQLTPIVSFVASTSDDLILADLKLEACSSKSELGKISGFA